MRFTISQRFFFDAAHTLKRDIEVEGSRRIHGHTYHAEVWLAGQRDPVTGMVVDLGVLRRRLDDVLATAATVRADTEFRPRTGPWCAGCDLLKRCPEGQREVAGLTARLD